MRRLPALLFALLLLTAAACDTGDPGGDNDDLESNDEGLVTVESDRSFSATVDTLAAALTANPGITLIQNFSHSANAASVGLELDSTRVLLFGNPNLGTPLMQAAQTTGIDLPQKMLVYQEGGDVFVAYNATAYLDARHTLPADVDDVLGQIDGALGMFAEQAADDDIEGDVTADDVEAREGLVIDTSTYGFQATYDSLTTALQNAGPISIVAEVDHAANAASVDMELDSTRLVIFGNPALGTPLMQIEQSIGIDLPQKFLVYQNDEGTVFTAYNDPVYLARRHGIDPNTEQIQTIAGALANFAAAATGTGGGSEED